MNRLIRSLCLLLVILLVASTAPTRAIAQSRSAPDWLAWKAFHQSLAFYQSRSNDKVSRMLAVRFGVKGGDETTLLQAGQSYVKTIDSIDADARADVRARWGAKRIPKLPNAANGRAPAMSNPPIVLERGKTLVQMARESGMYDRVEAQKNAALVAYLQDIRQALGPATSARLAKWVQSSVAPQITVGERSITVPNLVRNAR